MGFSTVLLLVIGSSATALVLLVLFRNLQATGPATPVARSRTTRARKASAPKQGTSPGSPFRAVSINPGVQCCAAARALEGKYYLVELDEIPELPLPACNAARCGCRYNHHADRRSPEDDRRSAASLRTELHAQGGNIEQRTNHGRRTTDKK
jgi:hypothetical protein